MDDNRGIAYMFPLSVLFMLAAAGTAMALFPEKMIRTKRPSRIPGIILMVLSVPSLLYYFVGFVKLLMEKVPPHH